ncbi:hypothetical protein BS50DRAFT_682274 [Corynespora cassiicola Philippines]|uniref:Uncharacterized protein n=1 Tax=Corynespora cassiicola Philippines TaxID=1448308 RepID=A0A2T2N1U9_CORCC|nr:hypothetical protein BS50DRAFT_682274 [Corynespora cassiicola Philippines]
MAPRKSKPKPTMTRTAPTRSGRARATESAVPNPQPATTAPKTAATGRATRSRRAATTEATAEVTTSSYRPAIRCRRAKVAEPSADTNTYTAAKVTVIKTKTNTAAASAVPAPVPSYQQPTIASRSKDRRSPPPPPPPAAIRPLSPTVFAPTAPTTTANGAPAVKSAPPKAPADPRDAYGSRHAQTEDEMMAQHATLCLENGIIDCKTATELARPWHGSGVLDLKWKAEHLDLLRPDVASAAEDVMDLREAEAAQRKRDAAMKRFVVDFEAGVIDEEGRGVVVVEDDVIVEEEKSAPAEEKTKEKKKAENNSLTKVKGGRVEKKPSAKKAVAAASTGLPGLGLPDYSPYSYVQCAALCAKRNIIAKGNVGELRIRLMQDDYSVVNGLEREARTYSNKRQRATQAPAVPGAPAASPAKGKRKRGGEGRGEAKRQKKSS